MCKVSARQRNNKRIKLVSKHAEERAKLVAILRDLNATMEEKLEASLKLQKLPKDSSKIRVRNRCIKTGRPRGNIRYFGTSRIILRQLAGDGCLPGVTKASW